MKQLPQANHTQVHNYFLDECMSKLSGSATKVFCAISRKTTGWHKLSDRIAYSQLRQLTGIESHNTLKKAVEELEDMGLVAVNRKKGTTSTFDIAYDFVPRQKLTGGESKNDTVPRQNLTIQKKEEKKLEKEIILRTADGTAISTIVIQAMGSKYGKFSNYKREATAAKHLVERAKILYPDRVEEFLVAIIGCYWKQTQNGHRALKGKPFTPSTLDTDWIWNENYEVFKKAGKDQETATELSGVLKEIF